MLAVSSEFLQAVKTKQPQDIRLEFTGGNVIGLSDIAITAGGLEYAEVLNDETDMTFGRAVMSELSVTLLNADSKFTDFNFEREFTAKIGVRAGDSFEYVSLGVFRGERPDKVRGKMIEFSAHDRMSLFDRPAESFADGLTFPCTLGQIYTKLCDFCGAGYVSAEFPNSGKTFETNPLEDTDYTCREILGYIAEAAGSYARMSRDGAVELVWFAPADYTVTRTDRFEMTESEFLTPPVDKLEVYNSYGDQLNTSGTGDIVYGISDNPFLYIENDTQLAGLQPYVDVIYNRITSLPAYHPSSFRAEFNPAVQCGDIISVVDDYGETISLPVFVQTITWTGFGKATYENTGGVIRQNAPFTQRELEQIKKKSLRAADLYTTIDSYLSTEEGIASITTAVEGKFVTESALNEYAKTTQVSAAIKQKITAFGASLKLSATTEETSNDEEGGEYGEYVSVTFSGTVGDPYGFEKTADGYYTSQNGGVDASFSYGKWRFNNTSGMDKEVLVRCISYGESGFDYGIISNLNTDLSASYEPDSSGVFYSFKGVSSDSPLGIQMTIPQGSSYFTFKYVKDTSSSKGGDYFKLIVLELITVTTKNTSSIKLTQNGIEQTSVDLVFNGFVTFNDLAGAGKTTINGANVTTENLFIKNIYFNNADNDRLILTSELNENGSGQIKFGFMEYMASSAWRHDIKLYAKNIWFIPPNGDENSNETLVFSLNSRTITANKAWTLDNIS